MSFHKDGSGSPWSNLPIIEYEPAVQRNLFENSYF